MNIVVIGQKGSGKTEIAKLLSRRLNRRLVSTTDELEKKIKSDKEKYIKKFGLEKYMEVLSETIENICKHEDGIIDTAEEVVLRKENVNNLKSNGLIILLTADPKTIASRIMKTQPAEKIKELSYSYDKSIAASDYVVDTSNVDPEEVCEMIMHYIELELR